MNPVEIKRGDSFLGLSNYLLRGKSNAPSVDQILVDITQQNSVFTRQELARHLNKLIDDEATLRHVMDKVLTSAEVVVMQSNDAGDERVYYSSWDMVSLEKTMIESAEKMAETEIHGVEPVAVDRSVRHANEALQVSANAHLSEEQIEAVRYVTGQSNLAVVSGIAGAGKSTMLAAAREAWEAQGYQVYGAALAGKAAEGLQESSNIESRTLASIEMGWKNGYGELSKGDVLVIDEAGMIGSRQLSRFIAAAEKAQAKLVLVGDSEQLQAIGAGAPFRQSVEKLGATQLEQVLRQKEEWQRTATQQLAKAGTAEALQAYSERRYIAFMDDHDHTVEALVADYLIDMNRHPDGSRLALAHRRVDVQEINQTIRDWRIQYHQIDQGVGFKTDLGKREFSVGDRLIFLENSRDLNVKNGMLGTIVGIENGKITTQLDGDEQRLVSVSEEVYSAIDHGYATTIHKSQGTSVDRAFVMASHTMDRHLTYVAMSRHKQSAMLYANGEQFNSLESLVTRLGRDGNKKTTLDCTIDMAKSMREATQEAPLEERVGWTQTYNLGKTKDLNAWEIMKATSNSADDLKEATAMANGKKYRKSKQCEKPVYHYSITWPDDDRPKLDERLQREAIDESLKALGLEEFQALAVQHLDGKPHVHVMVNLIHPETGMSASTAVMQANGKKASKLSNSHRKLRQWANRFEKHHGLQITEGSVLNEQKRQAGETVHAQRKNRKSYERDVSENPALNLDDFVYVHQKDDGSLITDTASSLAGDGRRIEEESRAAFTAHNTGFADQMQALYEQKAEALDVHKKAHGSTFKPQWTAVARANHKRMDAFVSSERSSLDSFFNSVTTYFVVKKERDNIIQGLYATTSSRERRELIERWNKAEFAGLAAREKAECAVYLDKHVHRVFDQKIERAQLEFLKKDERLREKHASKTRELSHRWRDYSEARKLENGQYADQSYGVEQGYAQSVGMQMTP